MNDADRKSAIKAGVAYFALVLTAGFLLGAVRVTLLVPSLGERLAELVEMPVLLAAILLAARFITRRFALSPRPSVRLATGFLALGLALLAELLLVVLMQEGSIREYLASRDPVSGGAFLALLLVFALMPTILARGVRERGAG